MDELIIEGKVYVPTRRAAEITGYAKDYIGQLCREGRVEAKLVGRSWYVLETSLREHRFGSEGTGAPSEEAVTVSPEVPSEPEPTATWEQPSYTAEEAPEIVPLNSPNYLENTQDNEDAANQEPAITPSVESAWEDWYAKSGRPVEVEEVSEEQSIEESLEEEPQPLEEEMPMPVRTIPGSMDIEPTPHMSAVEEELPQQAVYEPRMEKKRTRRSFGPRIYKALFVAYVILVVAIVILGTGFLEAMPENPLTDFLGGISRFESS